jgi:hypothetical protein
MKVTVPVAVPGATVALRLAGWPNIELVSGAKVVVVVAVATVWIRGVDVLVA